MQLSKACLVELSELSSKAERLARGNSSERKQADALMQRIGTLRQIGLSTKEIKEQYSDALIADVDTRPADQEYRYRFDRYVAGRLIDQEMRDFLSGTQSIFYTSGPSGGYMVPMSYDSTLREAMAQVDPVLDEKVCSFTMTPTPSLQPQQISGYDLSSIAAQNISEGSQQTGQVIPSVAGAVLASNKIFRASFGASWEAEEDIPAFSAKIVRASGVALSRAIGRSVISGRGSQYTSEIEGLVQLITPTQRNGTSGKLTLSDITSFYFAVNRFYRAAPKAGWLLSDGCYQLLRNATDNSGRPLIDVEGDTERLMGKPLFVSPSMATAYSSIGLTGALIFGDLSSIAIRASRPELRRSIENALVDITKGEALWTARCRADATYFDPSGGVTPPLVLATIN